MDRSLIFFTPITWFCLLISQAYIVPIIYPNNMVLLIDKNSAPSDTNSTLQKVIFFLNPGQNSVPRDPNSELGFLFLFFYFLK